MAEKTLISWTDRSWNPWEGCTKISTGCQKCYAAVRNHRFGQDNWGKGKPRRRTSPSGWKKPLAWNRAAKADQDQFEHQDAMNGHAGLSQVTVFPSLCDWLDDEVPIEWLADFLNLIHATPRLTWLLLTKRPENFTKRIVVAAGQNNMAGTEAGIWAHNWWNGSEIPANVWLGVSTENQEYADKRIPELLKIPAKIRFISAEPLLGPIEFTPYIGGFTHRCKCKDRAGVHNGFHETEYGIFPNGFSGGVGGTWYCPHCCTNCETRPACKWIIAGAESGPNSRPCNIQWIRDIVKQCKAAGTAVFVKQLGAVCISDPSTLGEWPVGTKMHLTDVARAMLKDKKGGDMAEWPEALRIREFPKLT